jgi:hypothetical protein
MVQYRNEMECAVGILKYERNFSSLQETLNSVRKKKTLISRFFLISIFE